MNDEAKRKALVGQAILNSEPDKEFIGKHFDKDSLGHGSYPKGESGGDDDKIPVGKRVTAKSGEHEGKIGHIVGHSSAPSGLIHHVRFEGDNSKIYFNRNQLQTVWKAGD